jgi:5-methylcytosine-specific restriction enzyme A
VRKLGTLAPRIAMLDRRVKPLPRVVDSLYTSAAWRAMRLVVLRRDGYRCVVCRISVAGKGQARVDHIIRVEDGGARLDPANCRSLCPSCDNQAHREKGSGAPQRDERFAIKGADLSGRPLDPLHPWNRPRAARGKGSTE